MPGAESLTMIVLGIDPGLANTGYGVVARCRGGRLAALDGGVIETPAGLARERRLADIHEEVERLISTHEPDAMALEELYFGQNVRTAFAVGHARGVVMLAAGQRGLPCTGYTPQQVKGAVCGNGRAGKDQVARMVKTLLGLAEEPRPITPPTRWRSRSATPTARRCRSALARAGRMIALLRGEVAVRRADHVVILCDSVGYRAAVSAETLRHVPPVGEQVTLHAHLIVRDDALALYGFHSEQERDLFLMLLSVQAVGPKVALAVLSGGTPRELIAAIAAGDAARFQAVPGIGKRTAERIIVELREKVLVRTGRRCRGRDDPRRTRRSPRGHGGGRGRRGLARAGLIELGYAPGEAEEPADGRPGRERRGADRARPAPRAVRRHERRDGHARDGAHPDPVSRRRGRARPLAASAPARGVRRPGGAARAAGRSRSRPPARAATRSTTCCSPGRPGWARPRWRRSSPPSWTCRSCRPPGRRSSARETSPRS